MTTEKKINYKIDFESLPKPDYKTAKSLNLKPLIEFCESSNSRLDATKLTTYAQELLPVRGMDNDLALLMALSAHNSQNEKLIQQAEAIIVSHMDSDPQRTPFLTTAYSHIATSETLPFMAPKICEAYRAIPDTYIETIAFTRDGCGYCVQVHEPNEDRDHYEDALKRLTKNHANVVDEPTINRIIKRPKLGANRLIDQEQINPTSMLEIGCNVIEHPEACLRPEVKKNLLGMMNYSAENTVEFIFWVDRRPPIVQRVETLLYGKPIARDQLKPIKLLPL